MVTILRYDEATVRERDKAAHEKALGIESDGGIEEAQKAPTSIEQSNSAAYSIQDSETSIR